MGITDKIAEVVLIVLLVIEGRRDRRDRPPAEVPGTCLARPAVGHGVVYVQSDQAAAHLRI